MANSLYWLSLQPPGVRIVEIVGLSVKPHLSPARRSQFEDLTSDREFSNSPYSALKSQSHSQFSFSS